MSYPNAATSDLSAVANGTINGLAGEVIVPAHNCASGIITVSGTFEGVLEVVGSLTSGGPEGGRLLFQSGVGSIGTNKIAGYGSAVNREYRFVDGGEYVKVRAVSWVSGSVDVRISVSPAPTVGFVIGPVHGSFEGAQRAGRAYSVGTSVQAVSATNYLKYRFANPANSGKRYFVTERWFTNDQSSGDANIESGFFPTYATDLPASTSVTPNNLLPSGGASDAVFQWNVNTNTLGTPALGQVLPVDGVLFNITIMRIVDPGQSFAYQMGGAGGGLNNAARLAATLIWYEEDLQ